MSIINELGDLIKKLEESLKKKKIELDNDKKGGIKILEDAMQKVSKDIATDVNITGLLKNSDDLNTKFAMRLSKIKDILKKHDFFDVALKCNFSNNKVYELSLKTLERCIYAKGDLEDAENVCLNNSKKLKQISPIEGAVLKLIASFIRLIHNHCSSVVQNFVDELQSPILINSHDKGMKLVSANLQKFCRDKYELLQKNGVLGSAFRNDDDINNFKIFNFDEKGNIKIDSKSYTQGIIKNCYFISALRSLSNNSNFVDYIRNCFDRMSDDDLKFTNEKTTNEKMDKVFTVGFFTVDYDSLSIDELQHLGSMNKKDSELTCKSGKIYYEIKCKDLIASGIESKGTELWPLLLESAWGQHLVHESSQLGKIKERLPFKYKNILDPKSSFPDVIENSGPTSVLSRYANNMYNSIALATLTGKKTKVKSISETEWISKKLLDLKGRTVMTVFKGREDQSGEKREHTKYTDPVNGRSFMLFSGHAVSVKDCFINQGTTIVELHDTMNTIGENGIFHLTLEDFNKEFDNVITVKN